MYSGIWDLKAKSARVLKKKKLRNGLKSLWLLLGLRVRGLLPTWIGLGVLRGVLKWFRKAAHWVLRWCLIIQKLSFISC